MEAIQFLSHEQVCELTGAKIRAKQIEALRRNGIPHTIKANGWPCVIAANLLPVSKVSVEREVTWRSRKAG
ncbi:DUF4224 domain-containing protein [Pseudomonas sp. AA-38]|uniref:DUF4224 domain-containing protein n=1 Tax=Pseudomonas sp. AA-38 TaxID=3028807 RepID=UPI0023F7D07D|nr:DUF4224 domain-containing protein [Pseudomonas sp. AA-38]